MMEHHRGLIHLKLLNTFCDVKQSNILKYTKKYHSNENPLSPFFKKNIYENGLKK